MTYQDFIDTVQFMGPTPQTHDYYRVRFNGGKTDQDFLDYFASHVPGLPSYPFAQRFNEFYFCMPVDKSLPDDFADNVEKATDKPSE